MKEWNKMKKILFCLLFMGFLLTSCDEIEENQSSKTDDTEQQTAITGEDILNVIASEIKNIFK